MAQVTDFLSTRLAAKGLSSVEIPRFIRDVGNIIEDNDGKALPVVNRKVVGLGWSEEILDSVSFELICFCKEV